MSTHSLGHDDLGSSAQRERRTRILDATVALATEGGFDAVQMRAVAELADVALGTLYRYFPSKIHLLVSALGRELERAHQGITERVVPGDSAAERVTHVLGRTTRTLQQDPRLTEALIRAFMFADASVATEIQAVGLQVTQLLMRAMTEPVGTRGHHEPTKDEIAITRVIGDVWFAALVRWVTGRASAQDVAQHMDTAIHLLLR